MPNFTMRRSAYPTLLNLAISAAVLVLTTLPSRVQAQIAGCAFQGAAIEQCLNQQQGFISLKPCCAALDQAIQVGFYCLCSLIASAKQGPEVNLLLSASMLSGCQISVPPLTALCQVLAPTPVFLPAAPEPPGEPPRVTPSVPPPKGLVVPLPPPPPPEPPQPPLLGLYVPPSPALGCSYVAGEKRVPCVDAADTSWLNWVWGGSYYSPPSSNGNKASALSCLSLIIFSVLCEKLLLL